jgi:hypothetical protein
MDFRFRNIIQAFGLMIIMKQAIGQEKIIENLVIKFY